MPRSTNKKKPLARRLTRLGGQVAFGASIALPILASAAGIVKNPLKADSILALLGEFLDGIVSLGAIALVLAFVWVGFLFVAAQGSDEKLKSARTTLVWTVVGGLVLLGAKLIASVITSTVQSIS
jgi:hypothetical protein